MLKTLGLLLLAACGGAATTTAPTPAHTETTPAASGFACGDKACTADQLCTSASGQGQARVGAAPASSSTSYSCSALPNECKLNPTCACLHLSASMCSVDKDGHVSRVVLMQ